MKDILILVCLILIYAALWNFHFRMVKVERKVWKP